MEDDAKGVQDDRAEGVREVDEEMDGEDTGHADRVKSVERASGVAHRSDEPHQNQVRLLFRAEKGEGVREVAEQGIEAEKDREHRFYYCVGQEVDVEVAGVHEEEGQVVGGEQAFAEGEDYDPDLQVVEDSC